MQTFSAGDVEIRVINVGDMKFRLVDDLNVPESDWRPKYGDLFNQSILIPSNSIHVELPNASIIIDPNDYLRSCPPGSEYFPSPDFRPQPDLLRQLSEISVKPDDITHVVVTHAHYDHFAGVTVQVAGNYEPAFPNAKYFLGAGEEEQLKKGLAEGNSEIQTTFGVLKEEKLLEFVREPLEIGDAARIIPAPGESPGHQIIEVNSSRRTFYLIGDLFHHWVEVEQIDWNPKWGDPRQNSVSRKSLYEAAVSRDALVIPAHMKPGRIRRGGDSSFRWEEEPAVN